MKENTFFIVVVFTLRWTLPVTKLNHLHPRSDPVVISFENSQRKFGFQADG